MARRIMKLFQCVWLGRAEELGELLPFVNTRVSRSIDVVGRDGTVRPVRVVCERGVLVDLLHLAIRRGALACVRTLAPMVKPTEPGYRALDEAMERNDADCVKALVPHFTDHGPELEALLSYGDDEPRAEVRRFLLTRMINHWAQPNAKAFLESLDEYDRQELLILCEVNGLSW